MIAMREVRAIYHQGVYAVAAAFRQLYEMIEVEEERVHRRVTAATRRYLEKGLSSYNLRHSFVASGTFESPFKAGPGNNWMERAFADITLSPIITLRSGFPFNLFIGRDVNGDLNTTDRPFHAPRNSGVGENFYSVDLRMSKLFYLRQNAEGPKVEFIVEATNLLITSTA